jgi:type II secretory pathway component PulF
MPTYAYRAVDVAGKQLAGQTVAATVGAAARGLEERGLLVLDVDEAVDKDAGGRWFRLGRRREVLEVTRAMAALLPVGMPLTQALAAASNVATGDVRAAVYAIRDRVERGDPLAEALADHSRLFPPLYVGLVRAGERSGALDGAFARLADQLERQEELRSKLLSASIYPLLLATAGTIAVTVLLVFVIPRFAELLEGSGAELPATTATLLAVGTALRRFWPLLLLVPVAITAGATWVRSTAEGARAWATLLLTVPLVRMARKQALAARFARLTGVLLGGGAPLLTALDDVIASLVDPIARDEASRIRSAVREGRRLADAVGESAIFPPLLSQLICIGEEAGRLQEFLDKAADIFEEKTQRATQRLATLAEPVMILIFGLVVAFVALSLLQAIYGVNTASFR